DLHEAARVRRHYRVDPRLLNGVHLVVDDGDRQLRVLDGEGTAEAAARLRVGELDELHATHPREQPPRLTLHTELPEGVTGVVPGDTAGEARAHVLHAQHIDQEGAQLVSALRHRPRTLSPLLAILEQVLVVVHHGRARPGGSHDGVRRVALVRLDEASGEGTRRLAVAGVEGGLATTGLAFVESHLAPDPPQHLHRAGSHGRPELADYARNEEGDAHQTLEPLRDPPRVTTPFTKEGSR